MEHVSDTAARLDELMAEIGWVRRVALALVKDAAAADDVAQDAWLLAMRHPPAAPRPLRPWLRRVVLNVARMRHRAARRRDLRDLREAQAEPRDVPTPADLVERVELQRAVADEVLALTEPYRGAVLLHFVEGLSSAQIARRLDVPDGTVRRRLKVAIDQLRERLAARDDGPRRGWLAALIPFARGPELGPTAATTLGVLTMKKVIAVTVALVVVLLLLGGIAWWRNGDRRPDPEGAVITAEARAGRTPAGHDPQRATILPSWIAQIGVPGRRVAGHVSSADGPVAGATVRLALVAAPDLMQPIAERSSGPDGAFDFGVEPATSFTVSAEAPNLTPASTVVSVADPRARPDQIALLLGGCRSRLYGSVVDASGGGIAKARLASTGLGGTESDATGNYSLCLPDRDSRVRVEADGYGTITLPFHLYGALHHDVVLVPEAILVGQVVADGQTPVPGARVIARPDNVDGLHHVAARWTTADRDGRFQIAGLAPGKFQLRAVAEGLATSTPQLAIARPATSSHELRITVEHVAQVRGRVVMAGAPVGGARITAAPSGGPANAVSYSQADGSFVLSGVPLGTVVFAASPYEVRGPKSVAITRAVVDDVVLDVAAMATLRGHVTRGGKPVAGADVSALRPATRAKTDASGGFVLEGLPAGGNRIHAMSLELRAVADDKLVTLAAGDDQTLDIELEHGARVTGTIVDQDGRPVPDVYMRLMPVGGREGARGGESMTDASGAFDCGSVPGGDYLPEVYPAPLPARAFAAADGARPDPIHVPRDGVVTGVRVAIKYERVAIRGRVVDDLGAEVPDVHVQAIGGYSYGNMTVPSAMTDVSGRFEIGGLARGAYNLHAHAADGSEAELLGIVTGAQPVTIKLARPGAIEGTLVGFSTPPIVELHTETPDLSTGSRAIVDGTRFSAPGLPPGRYTVQARAGTDVDGQTVEVRPGETVRLTLRSRGLARVEGRITEYGSKAPVPGMRCATSLSIDGTMGNSLADQGLPSFSDASGHFSMPAPTGRVRVYCFAPNPGPLSIAGTDIDVTAAAIPAVELVAVRNTAGRSAGNPGFQFARGVLPLTVDQIAPGGPAAASGLAVGDHVVSIDGATLAGMLPMGGMYLLGNYRPGTTVTVGIERGGAAQTIKIVVGSTRH